MRSHLILNAVASTSGPPETLLDPDLRAVEGAGESGGNWAGEALDIPGSVFKYGLKFIYRIIKIIYIILRHYYNIDITR
jgi:hypothetical protein